MLLFPNWTLVENFRSIVLAATEINQGATFVIVEREGPSLPAEAEVNIPFLIA